MFDKSEHTENGNNGETTIYICLFMSINRLCLYLRMLPARFTQHAKVLVTRPEGNYELLDDDIS